jgi:predicted transposase/invertase (TIGR01784 family)
MSVYINPYTDFGFKKLFGEEANKNLLIDFLNQLLPLHHQIANLTFQNVEKMGDTKKERKAIFDIHCIAHSGERFVVEMQKAKVRFFKDRALFYTTFPIREQAKKGEWDFELKAIYFVAILDFIYDEAEEKAKFLRNVMLRDEDNQIFYEKLHFKFLQMPLFVKEEHELVTHFDKWCYFLKNLQNLENIPSILQEPIFEQAFQTAKLVNFTARQRNAYEKSKMDYLGVKAVADTAKEDGREIGLQQGLEQGLQKGLEQGLQQGLEQGIMEGAQKKEIETLLGMYKNNIPIAIIANVLNITVEKVMIIIENFKSQ